MPDQAGELIIKVLYVDDDIASWYALFRRHLAAAGLKLCTQRMRTKPCHKLLARKF